VTNTEDYQPQGTDISVDHHYDSRHFKILSTACFRDALGHTYPSYFPPHTNHYSVSAVFSTLKPAAPILRSGAKAYWVYMSATQRKYWHRAMIGRFVPKDWDCRVPRCS
jgi:hypothetical protein